MESNWTKADFRSQRLLQGACVDLLRSTNEVLARELALSLSAFLRCSVTATYLAGEELTFGDLPVDEPMSSCLATAVVRPGERRLRIDLEHSVLFPLVGLALGAKAGSFTAPGRQPTDIEAQIVKILFRLMLAEAFRGWMPLVKLQLETAALEIDRSPGRTFHATDAIFVARFEIRLGEQVGRLSIVTPLDIFANAAAEETIDLERAQTAVGFNEATLRLMLPAKVSVDVWLDGSQMRLRDLLHLREGQVVKLDHPIERKAICMLNGTAGFSGQIVSTGARRAFLVEESTER
jgi:flagellar motor switch protein FliM